MASRDLERLVKISAPYDSDVHAEVVVESLPVYFDLGWQKVEGQDYGPFADYPVASSDAPAPVRSTYQPVVDIQS